VFDATLTHASRTDAVEPREWDAMHIDDAIPLADARYDAFVVWCEEREKEFVAIDVAITTGVHKGDALTIVALRAALHGRDVFDVIGVPCTLVVRDAQPSIEW
jgi:hypothetical protein